MPNDTPPADAYDWGPDPPPFTAEEIEDLRQNGIDGAAFIAALLAELEAEPCPDR